VIVPGLGGRIPEVSNSARECGSGECEIYVIVNGVPDRTLGSWPDARVTFVKLDGAMMVQNFLDLEDGGPEDWFGGSIFGKPEAGVGEVFSF
jgi:hypothetical protein